MGRPVLTSADFFIDAVAALSAASIAATAAAFAGFAHFFAHGLRTRMRGRPARLLWGSAAWAAAVCAPRALEWVCLTWALGLDASSDPDKALALVEARRAFMLSVGIAASAAPALLSRTVPGLRWLLPTIRLR
jgi:hypothetical protein